MREIIVGSRKSNLAVNTDAVGHKEAEGETA